MGAQMTRPHTHLTPHPGLRERRDDASIGTICFNLLGTVVLGLLIVFMGKMYLANAEILKRHGEDDPVLVAIASITPDAWTFVGAAAAADTSSVDVKDVTARAGVCLPQ